jgi:3-deoxy-D-manno-octulosonate 8-phosphate phosphatase (KDO 8-P phosphatase)
MLPKIIATDIDGVWTDGGMYYDQTGNEFKKFNTYDSAGVLWCKLNTIPVVIITGENTEIVKRRAKKLKVDHLFLGCKNKVYALDKLLKSLSLEWSDLAYIGDDINDFKVIEKSGYSACPINAPDYIKEIVNDVLPCKGGDGAFRQFVEKILSNYGLMKPSLDLYFSSQNNKLNQ